MYGECEDCVKTDLNEDMLLVNKDNCSSSDESSSSSDSDSDLEKNDQNCCVMYKEWAKDSDGKLKKLER